MKALLYCKIVGLGNHDARLVLARTKEGSWDWVDISHNPEKWLGVNASTPGEAVDALMEALSAVSSAILKVQAQCNSQSVENN
jgi:threonine dehydrogenase-like Zn-dependent dehydrogenase